MKRTDIYLAIMDVGLFLLSISPILINCFGEKEIGAVTLIVGSSFGVGGLGTFAIHYILKKAFGKTDS